MKSMTKMIILLCIGTLMASCVGKKKYAALRTELETANKDLTNCNASLSDHRAKLSACDVDLKSAQKELNFRQEQITSLKDQLDDLKKQRDNQVTQVGDLTVLSQSANENIKETLAQLQKKDEYIHLLQAAKTKADSINLALSVNLKGVLQSGINDKDVEIKVDKTVVMINLSDKMLYQSGSAKLTARATEVLGKIAEIIKSRPELEVMVEGYTDNVPIKNNCIDDNWDLSVKRATSVVRVLHKNFNIDPNRLIAAGRGEFNTLASNDTAEGRSTNRRTRIIILPKLDQFYDLLNPKMVPK